jgi:hypothetical protein
LFCFLDCIHAPLHFLSSQCSLRWKKIIKNWNSDFLLNLSHTFGKESLKRVPTSYIFEFPFKFSSCWFLRKFAIRERSFKKTEAISKIIFFFFIHHQLQVIANHHTITKPTACTVYTNMKQKTYTTYLVIQTSWWFYLSRKKKISFCLTDENSTFETWTSFIHKSYNHALMINRIRRLIF